MEKDGVWLMARPEGVRPEVAELLKATLPEEGGAGTIRSPATGAYHDVKIGATGELVWREVPPGGESGAESRREALRARLGL